MARIKTGQSFPANFERLKAQPLIDWYCETLADLTNATEQQAYDGNTYVYYHMQAIVFNDGANNGTYWLIDVNNPTLPASWERLGTGGSSLTPTMDVFLISNTDITNGYIDLVNTPSNDIILFYDGLEEPKATGLNPSDGFWTISTNRLTFNNPTKDLYEGAKINVKYTY